MKQIEERKIAKEMGYTLVNIENYPKTDDHLECYTDLPCYIEKGREEFRYKKRWYVSFFNEIDIDDKSYGSIDKAIIGALSSYKKYLKSTLAMLDSGVLK